MIFTQCYYSYKIFLSICPSHEKYQKCCYYYPSDGLITNSVIQKYAGRSRGTRQLITVPYWSILESAMSHTLKPFKRSDLSWDFIWFKSIFLNHSTKKFIFILTLYGCFFSVGVFLHFVSFYAISPDRVFWSEKFGISVCMYVLQPSKFSI